MATIRVLVDGFTHHNRQLKVIHPDEPGPVHNSIDQ